MMLTVVWDVDDILNDLMYQWFIMGGWRSIRSAGFPTSAQRNPPHQVLGVDRGDYLNSMDQFRETERART